MEAVGSALSVIAHDALGEAEAARVQEEAEAAIAEAIGREDWEVPPRSNPNRH